MESFMAAEGEIFQLHHGSLIKIMQERGYARM